MGGTKGGAPFQGLRVSQPGHLSGCLLQLLLQLLHSDLQLLYAPQDLSPLLFHSQHLALELRASAATRSVFMLEGRRAPWAKSRTFQDQTKRVDYMLLKALGKGN